MRALGILSKENHRYKSGALTAELRAHARDVYQMKAIAISRML